jgi:hypothetical protein
MSGKDPARLDIVELGKRRHRLLRPDGVLWHRSIDGQHRVALNASARSTRRRASVEELHTPSDGLLLLDTSWPGRIDRDREQIREGSAR